MESTAVKRLVASESTVLLDRSHSGSPEGFPEWNIKTQKINWPGVLRNSQRLVIRGKVKEWKDEQAVVSTVKCLPSSRLILSLTDVISMRTTCSGCFVPAGP